MSVTLQNLRSVTPGFVPGSLAPGQLCFNLVDEIMFVGDGTGYQTSFDGTQVATAPGAGWFSIPLSLDGLSDYFLANPSSYGDIPADGDVLAYSSTLGKPVWVSAGADSSAYTTTNAAVAAAPGVSASAKISNALGITPVESDLVIVSGVPGDLYQGFYIFLSGNWTFAAGYADPTALQVPYNNTVSGLLATTVQAALDELASSKLNAPSNTPVSGDFLSWNGTNPVWVTAGSVYPDASQVIFDNTGTSIPYTNVQQALVYTWDTASNALSQSGSAETTANNALAVANAALPESGGTMTGDITFNDGQPVDAGTF